MRRARRASLRRALRRARAPARPPPRRAEPAGVSVQFEAFAPVAARRAAGRDGAVVERQRSARTPSPPTTGSFDSGDVAPGGRSSRAVRPARARTPTTARIHPGMVGEVDVRRVILDPLPTAAVPAGAARRVHGPHGGPGAAGDGPARASAAGLHDRRHAPTPAADGTWTRHGDGDGDRPTTARSPAPTSARPGGCSSATGSVVVRATRRGVARRRSPRRSRTRRVVLAGAARASASAGGRPRRARLDYLSRAELPRARPRARARACSSTRTAGRRSRRAGPCACALSLPSGSAA